MTRRTSQILALVAEQFGVTLDALVAKDRHRSLVEARQVGYWMLRYVARYSFPEIGIEFNRDHTTIMSGVRKLDRMMAEDPEHPMCVAASRIRAVTSPIAPIVSARAEELGWLQERTPLASAE